MKASIRLCASGWLCAVSPHGNYLLLTNKERLRRGIVTHRGEIVHLSADVVTIKHYDTLINYPLDFKRVENDNLTRLEDLLLHSREEASA